jgi:nitroimidazol reductase NimA-like FMN-containing flavoprotein (pyridoxamine 5'-phosphate oxidase superfamily)
MYVYEEGEVLYLHTGARGGHFHSNVTRTVSDVTMPASIVVGDDTTRNSFREGARICISVSEPGPMHTGTPSPCNSALVYQSAILFGKVHVCEGADIDERKTWFFDRLLQRLGDSRSNYAAGYTMLKQITLYEVAIEILTGKINAGLHH